MENSKKSSKKWAKGVISSLHHLAHKQWTHRNNVKQESTNPQVRMAERELNKEITKQLLTRMHELYPQDRRNLNRNLTALLSKKRSQKLHWFERAQAARQKFIRDREQDQELRVKSRKNSALLKMLHNCGSRVLNSNGKRPAG